MRLVDADALNKELQKRFGSPVDDKLYEVNLCIINAPTIDAIPVEWLRGLMNILVSGYALEQGQALFLSNVIEAWQKEQEGLDV